MGALQMTYVSYFFAAMAVAFGSASVVMYFMFDIRRCWRIVRGAHFVAVREKVTVGRGADTEKKDSSFICQRTEKLAPDKTEALLTFEETVPLEAITLVQDIVMMTDAAATDAIMDTGRES